MHRTYLRGLTENKGNLLKHDRHRVVSDVSEGDLINPVMETREPKTPTTNSGGKKEHEVRIQELLEQLLKEPDNLSHILNKFETYIIENKPNADLYAIKRLFMGD